jgi:hypothetical protein
MSVMMEYPFQLTGNEKLKPYSVFWYSIDIPGRVVGNGVVTDGVHPVNNPCNESNASDRNIKYLGLRIFPLHLRTD